MAQSQETSVDQRLRESLARVAPHAAAPATATARAVKVETAVTPKQQVQEQEETDIVIQERTALELKIKENPFYESQNNSQLSQQDKAEFIANALNPQKQTMEKVNENLRLFEEYYTYIQSEELDQILESVQRALGELRGRSKVEIAKILDDLREMLKDVAVAKDLVEVMRRARLNGQTVRELSAACDRNEQIIAEIANKKAERETKAKEISDVNQVVTQREREQADAENTFGHKFWGVFKKDTTYSDRTATARNASTTKNNELNALDTEIAALEGQRRVEFEQEPLKILRSFDEADDNLTERLTKTGEAGIRTIQGAQKSALQLMHHALFSEEEVNKIASRVADKGLILNNLRAGLNLAAEQTTDFKNERDTRQAATEAALADARAPADGSRVDILKAANLEDESLRLKNSVGEVIDYQGRLGGTITEVNGAFVRNVERTQEVDRSREIVQGEKKSITMLGRDGLNTIGSNLEGVVHNLMAEQTDEKQSAVIAFTRAAEEVRSGTQASMIERMGDQKQRELDITKDSITRLNNASNAIANMLDRATQDGVKIAEARDELRGATEQLDRATSAARQIGSVMTEQAIGQSAAPAGEAPAEAPAEPAAAAEDVPVVEPVRPVTEVPESAPKP